MASITLKDIPEPLLERVRHRARSERRSLTQEIYCLLEAALQRPAQGSGRRDEANVQAEAWARLAGRWQSDLPVDEEIDRILSGRTKGRAVSL